MRSVKCPVCCGNFYQELVIINIENEFVCPHCEYTDSDFLVFIPVRKPDKLQDIDFSSVVKTAEKLIERSLSGDLEDTGKEEIYADFMEALYGPEIWDWLEENPHQFD